MTPPEAGGSIVAMHFHEVDAAGYRIYLGALESRQGDGYTAAVAVRSLAAGGGGATLFRDDQLACGHRWATADQALGFALRRGRAWVRAAAEADPPARPARPVPATGYSLKS